MKKKRALLCGLLAAAVDGDLHSIPAWSQTKVTRPSGHRSLRPGRGPDTMARLLAPYITGEFGQQVVIDIAAAVAAPSARR